MEGLTMPRMTLQKCVEDAKKRYEGKPAWMWNDEGIVYAMQDYMSSCELTEADREYAKSIGEADTLAWLESEAA